MKYLDFLLADGTKIRATAAHVGRSWVRLEAAYVLTPGGHALAGDRTASLELRLANVCRVYLDSTNPLTLAWDRDNPAQSTRDLRWIVRLHFGMAAPDGKS